MFLHKAKCESYSKRYGKLIESPLTERLRDTFQGRFKEWEGLKKLEVCGRRVISVSGNMLRENADLTESRLQPSLRHSGLADTKHLLFLSDHPVIHALGHLTPLWLLTRVGCFLECFKFLKVLEIPNRWFTVEKGKDSSFQKTEPGALETDHLVRWTPSDSSST